MTIRRKDNLGQALISAAQDITGSYVDLGEVVDCRDSFSIAIWLNVDINNGANVRIKALGKLTETATDEYNLPILTVSTSAVSVEDEYYEFAVDANQLALLEVETNDVIPYVQFQVSAGTPGTPAAQIDSANITFRHKEV